MKTEAKTQIFYRYEDTFCAPSLDEFDRLIGLGTAHVDLHEYEVIKKTPKGVWIKQTPFGGKKFVLLAARKRFACPTKEALESFLARKRKHLKILKNQVNRVETAIKIAERMEE